MTYEETLLSTVTNELSNHMDWDDFDLESASSSMISIIRAEQAKALRDAARYVAGGLHCMDMRLTPEETVWELNKRANNLEGTP